MFVLPQDQELTSYEALHKLALDQEQAAASSATKGTFPAATAPPNQASASRRKEALNDVPDSAWHASFVPSVLTLFGRPLQNEAAQVSKMPALDSTGKSIGQYELVATCLAGAFHFRVILEGHPSVKFKQLNLHLNDSTNPYGLGSINRDPWTRSEISLDGGVPITVLSNDMADTGKDYQSSFLFSDRAGESTGDHLFWVGQKSILLLAHKLVVTQTLDDERRISFSFNPQAKELKDFLVGRCGTN